MRYSVILEVPEDLDITAQNPDGSYVIGNDVVYEIGLLDGRWPSSPMVGTDLVNGRKLIQAAIETDASDPGLLLDALIAIYELDWVLCGLKTFWKQPQFDEFGDPLPDAATPLMPTDTATIFPYLKPRVRRDENGQILETLVPDISWLSGYSDEAPWV